MSDKEMIMNLVHKSKVFAARQTILDNLKERHEAWINSEEENFSDLEKEVLRLSFDSVLLSVVAQLRQ